MKRIGLTGRLESNSLETRECFDINWASLFRSLEFIPICIPMMSDYKAMITELELDGIIFSGGNDLSCNNPNKLSSERDSFEKDLIRTALEQKIPIFGVCRGMQIIADFFGAEFIKVEGHTATTHSLIHSEKSKYFSELQEISESNSYHNYAVFTAAEELQIVSKSADGTVEAVEHKTLLVFGQMWHPERGEFRSSEMTLIRNFFNGE